MSTHDAGRKVRGSIGLVVIMLFLCQLLLQEERWFNRFSSNKVIPMSTLAAGRKVRGSIGLVVIMSFLCQLLMQEGRCVVQ